MKSAIEILTESNTDGMSADEVFALANSIDQEFLREKLTSIPIFRILESIGFVDNTITTEKRLPTCLTLAKESSKLVGVGDDPATRMPRGKVIRVFFEPVQDHAGANVLFTETLAVRKPIAENIGDGGQKPRWRECRPIKNKLATSVV